MHIHHLDHPPLFTWVEWEYFKHNGRIELLKRVYNKEYLQKHFALNVVVFSIDNLSAEVFTSF